MEPMDFFKEAFPDSPGKLTPRETVFLTEFAKLYHEHELKEEADKVDKVARIETAQQYILNLEFGRWYYFDEIPEDIFGEVFALIEERFRGWQYFTSDEDTAFKKRLEYTPNNAKSGSFRNANRRKYESEIFTQGDSG